MKAAELHTVLLTVKQAAKILGVSESTIAWRMRAHGLTLQQAINAGGSMKPKIAPGDKFGSLTVVSVLPSKKGGNARVLVRCACGGELEVLALQVQSRNVVSCGLCNIGKELH